MTIIYRGAIHQLSVQNGQVVRQDGQLFDREGYSRFKYGWLPPAKTYAQEIAESIAWQLWVTAHRRPIHIVSAPYKHVPTASHNIALYLEEELAWRADMVKRDRPTVLPFHKQRVGSGNYAKRDQAYRENSLKTLGLHLDESAVTGSVIVVVDDIRITGAAERATASYLEALDPHAVFYMHAAKLSPQEAARHPGLEDELNQSVPHTFDRFLAELSVGEFRLNTRVLRLMLESAIADVQEFARQAPVDLLRSIIDGAGRAGDVYCAKYPETIAAFRDELTVRTSCSALSH